MKLVSFLMDGRPSYGILEDAEVVNVGSVLAPRLADLKSVLGEGDALALLRDAARSAPRLDLDMVTLLPPIPNPGKIFCIGHNYEEHRLEV